MLIEFQKLDETALESWFGAASPSGAARCPHNLPFASIGGLLRGRDGDLKTLRAGKGAVAIAQAIQGLGGIGKTRLAVELGWRAVQEGTCSAVLFAVADSLNANLAALAATLGLPEQTAREQSAQYDAVLRWLAGHDGWLLILDNVDAPEAATEVQALLPRLNRGRVLITSRLRGFGAAVEPVELHKLNDDVATGYLLDRTRNRAKTAHDDVDARTLAGLLDGLPLALEQAAAYIDAHGGTFADYLCDWERDRDRVLEWCDKAADVPVSVAVTWQRTWDVLGPAARVVLRVAAHLAPDPIPIALFEETASRLVEGFALLEDIQKHPAEFEARQAINELAHYSMIERDEDGFTVHRILQQAIRQRNPQVQRRGWIRLLARTIRQLFRRNHRQAWLELALNLLDDFLPIDPPPDDIRSWPRWIPMRSHVAAALRLAVGPSISVPKARLMNGLGLFLEVRAEYSDAEPLMRGALAISEMAFGSGHPSVGVCLNNLALLLQATDRMAEAETLVRRALAIAEKSFGADHPTVAGHLNNLASLFQDTNRLVEAEPLYRRALAIDEAAFGRNHPEVAVDLNNLEVLLKSMGRLVEAEPLARRALAIAEAAFGASHPITTGALSNLAQLLTHTDRVAEAEPLMCHALAIDESIFGPDHPKVALHLSTLATLLMATDRQAEAEPLLRRALAINEVALGPYHPTIAIALGNLATLLVSIGQPDEAESLVRRALIIDEVALGPNHPRIALLLNNLGMLLHATNRQAEAEPLLRRALATDEAALGPDAPEVAVDLNNLALLFRDTNRLAEAEPLMRRALAVLEQSLGPDHPNTQTVRDNLAKIERPKGRRGKKGGVSR